MLPIRLVASMRIDWGLHESLMRIVLLLEG